MTDTGASAPATTSAVATKTIEGRRMGRIAISPRFKPIIASAGLSRLYGGKKALAPNGFVPANCITESDPSLARRRNRRRTTVRERKKFNGRVLQGRDAALTAVPPRNSSSFQFFILRP